MMQPNVTLPHKGEPEIRSPEAPGREHNRASRRKAELKASQAADEYHSRDVLLKRHRDARGLSLYDGRSLRGFIVALPCRKLNWAFDRHERCLGAHRSLKQAVAAVNAAYDAEVRHA
jgi:hypothetical protein